MSINVPELRGKELRDITDCTHTHPFQMLFHARAQVSNSVYVCLNIGIHGLGLTATWKLHALKQSSAPSRAELLSEHTLSGKTLHTISSACITSVMNFFFSEALMINWYFEIFTLLGFYVSQNGGWLQVFQDNLKVPSSRAQQ